MWAWVLVEETLPGGASLSLVWLLETLQEYYNLIYRQQKLIVCHIRHILSIGNPKACPQSGIFLQQDQTYSNKVTPNCANSYWPSIQTHELMGAICISTITALNKLLEITRKGT